MQYLFKNDTTNIVLNYLPKKSGRWKNVDTFRTILSPQLHSALLV